MHEQVLNGLLLVQLPVTFYLALHGHPRAALLLATEADAHETAVQFSLNMTLPSLVVSALLLYAGLHAKHMQKEASSAPFDDPGDDDPSNDCIFWGASFAFVLLRNMLLIEDVDVFAVVLLSALCMLTEFVACARATTQAWLRIRIAAVTGFVGAVALTTSLVFISLDTLSEVYVLAMCLVADAVLIFGHVWDYPESTMQTVLNCRLVYMSVLQLALPLTIAAHLGVV